VGTRRGTVAAGDGSLPIVGNRLYRDNRLLLFLFLGRLGRLPIVGNRLYRDNRLLLLLLFGESHLVSTSKGSKYVVVRRCCLNKRATRCCTLCSNARPAISDAALCLPTSDVERRVCTTKLKRTETLCRDGSSDRCFGVFERLVDGLFVKGTTDGLDNYFFIGQELNIELQGKSKRC